MSLENLGRNTVLANDTKIKETNKKEKKDSVQNKNTEQENTKINTQDENQTQQLKEADLSQSLPQTFTDAMTNIFGDSDRVNGALPFSDLTENLPGPLKDIAETVGGVVGGSVSSEHVNDVHDASRQAISSLTSNPPDYKKFADICLTANSKLAPEDKEKLFQILGKSGKYFDKLKDFCKSSEVAKLNPIQRIALDTAIKGAENAKNNPARYPENSYDSFASKAMETLTSEPPDYKKFVKIAKKANSKLSKDEKKNLIGLLANSGEILDGFKKFKKSGELGFIDNFAAKKILGKVEKYNKGSL